MARDYAYEIGEMAQVQKIGQKVYTHNVQNTCSE